MYYQTKEIQSTKVGNNALSYEQRKAMGSSCLLSIPALKKGTLEDIKIGNEIVFEEIDHKGNIQSCIGLENLIQLDDISTPVYVIDNHNHALYLWYLENFKGTFAKGATVIHIDQHADMGIPTISIDINKCNDIDYISSYTNEVCNVGNFIQPAVDSGLIKDVIQIRSVSKLIETISHSPFPIPYILDIDIDFWVDHTPTKEEITAVHTLLEGASICIVALSPYFMPIINSIEVTKKIFSSLLK